MWTKSSRPERGGEGGGAKTRTSPHDACSSVPEAELFMCTPQHKIVFSTQVFQSRRHLGRVIQSRHKIARVTSSASVQRNTTYSSSSRSFQVRKQTPFSCHSVDTMYNTVGQPVVHRFDHQDRASPDVGDQSGSFSRTAKKVMSTDDYNPKVVLPSLRAAVLGQGPLLQSEKIRKIRRESNAIPEKHCAAKPRRTEP